MGRTHALTGVVVGVAAVAAARHLGVPVGVPQGAGVVVMVVVGSLLPDLDTRSAMASRVPVLGPVGCRVVRSVSAAAYRASRTGRDDPSECEHRYLTHTAAFAVAVGAMLAGVLAMVGLGSWWWLGAPLALGCVTHLLGDWVTPMGVPLLWPAVWRGKRWWRFRAPLTFRAGGSVETMVVAPLVAASGFVPLWWLLAG